MQVRFFQIETLIDACTKATIRPLWKRTSTRSSQTYLHTSSGLFTKIIIYELTFDCIVWIFTPIHSDQHSIWIRVRFILHRRHNLTFDPKYLLSEYRSAKSCAIFMYFSHTLNVRSHIYTSQASPNYKWPLHKD